MLRITFKWSIKMSKVILITGAAGFIGFHSCLKFLRNDFSVIGLDNLNSYYDINLKKSRLNTINEIAS